MDNHLYLLILVPRSVPWTILFCWSVWKQNLVLLTLNWFCSSNRSQKVSVEGVLSEKFNLDCAVPQGSCLGLLLFVIYSSKLFQIMEKHLPDVHCYADDTQLYLAFKPGSVVDEYEAISALELCISDFDVECNTINLSSTRIRQNFVSLVHGSNLQKWTFHISTLAAMGLSHLLARWKILILVWFKSNNERSYQ